MWRIKVTKYKNASPKIPKKEEWLTDLPVGNLKQSSGNHVKASCKFIAFNVDSTGGSLGVLPLEARGRQVGTLTTIHAHSDFVSDFDFSPFHDALLATGSYDGGIKIWNIPEETGASVTDAVTSLPAESRRIENLLWHPTAEDILAVGSHQMVKIWDVSKEETKYVLEGLEDQIQGFSWKGDGSLLTTTSKDKTIRIFDPRLQKVAQEAEGHPNVRDSRIVWLGNDDRIATTGFSQSRSREVYIHDARQLGQPLKKVEVDNSNATLMPFFDEDSNMLFFAGKGDMSINFVEVLDNEKCVTEGSVHRVGEQIRGLGMVPKLALDVMDAEVCRFMLLAQNMIIPIPYQVPRKSYTEYHEDLFPDTNSRKPVLTASEWIEGANTLPEKVSLRPKNMPRTASPATVHRATGTKVAASVVKSSQNGSNHQSDGKQVEDKEDSNRHARGDVPEELEEVVVKIANVLPGFRPSKFRHLKGTIMHKSTHFTNVRNLSKSVVGESDGFDVNPERFAVPLAGTAGLIGIFELSKPGRQPDTGIPALQNGTKVTDFTWDPFDNRKLVAGCDDGKIQIWQIPEGGLTTTLTEPVSFLRGHDERIYFVKYHPLASNVLASGSYDGTVRIWDVESGEEKIILEGHADSIFCFAWSPDGKLCATVCKDGKVRIYDPRNSTTPILVGRGPSGSRGARLVWTNQGKYLVVIGFDKLSNRHILIYDATDLSAALSKVDIDSSPLLLIPYYDEDSSTLFVTGRGEGLIRAYEISPESPHIFELSTCKLGELHQTFSFLPKNQCDVRAVEFAKCYRLTRQSIEPISFTVPRVKKEYFQDDLFPDTRVTWSPTVSAEEWFSGVDREPGTISLKPEDMENLSASKPDAPKPKKFESYDPETFQTPEQKKEKVLSAMTDKMDTLSGPLPQDLTEGCEADEWNE